MPSRQGTRAQRARMNSDTARLSSYYETVYQNKNGLKRKKEFDIIKRKEGGKSMPHQTGIKVIATNKKAFHDYFVEEKYECGIALFGTEVKSVRLGKVNLKESWAQVRKGEIWIEGMHISPYEQGNIFNRDPLRPKKLLLHKKEIRKLDGLVMRQGYTLVPLEVYLKDGRMKVQLGLCKGKQLHDKRDSMAKRDSDREIERVMKSRLKR